MVQRSEVTLNESLGSALVSSLAEEGRVADMRRVLQQVRREGCGSPGHVGRSLCAVQMQGRLRMQGRASVLSLACRSMDADLALEHLATWDVWQQLPDSLVGLLVALSRESGRPEVVERLLQTLHKTQQPVSREVAMELRQWAERLVVPPHQVYCSHFSPSLVLSSQPEPVTCHESTVSFRYPMSLCDSATAHPLTHAVVCVLPARGLWTRP